MPTNLNSYYDELDIYPTAPMPSEPAPSFPADVVRRYAAEIRESLVLQNPYTVTTGMRSTTVNPPSSREIVRVSAEANYGFGKWFKKVEKAYPLVPKKARKYTKRAVDNDPVIEVLSTGT